MVSEKEAQAVTLEERLKDVEKRYETLGLKIKELVETRSAIDRQMAQLREEQLKLEGEHRLLKKLSQEPVSA